MAATPQPHLPGPEEYAYDAPPILIQSQSEGSTAWTWAPMWHRECTFGPAEFDAVMQNLVRNPNVLSSWLFRADILAETSEAAAATEGAVKPFPGFDGFVRADDRTIVRRLIPRNTMRDKPMLQTCLFYSSGEEDGHEDMTRENSLVVYLPHITNPVDVPFYHPKVQGVGFLHEWDPLAGRGTMSIHFSFFEGAEVDELVAKDTALASKLSRPILGRVALSLINTVCKHGEGKRAGYVKRVHHDQLVPQARVQDRYTQLKEKYARRLVETWQETTDPAKHVFEDLAIAAFLMELWVDMYGRGSQQQGVPAGFPGFVDVGCGNGLLVYILNEEGYRGWGFDARKRRSWQQYGNGDEETRDKKEELLPLRESLLLPSFLMEDSTPEVSSSDKSRTLPIHDGIFPPGTFIIANHADELTVWTPLLAALSDCTFIAIPCCSHNFTGAKFRAPPPSAAAAAETAESVSVALASSSTYSSFVEWVASVAEDCGWHVEYEMLRIPSTRNVGLIGRKRRQKRQAGNEKEGEGDEKLSPFTVAQAWSVISKYGGAHGFADNVAKLAASGKKNTH